MTSLRPSEFARYSRQMLLPEIGIEGQRKLSRSRVLVVGAGGLGCPVLQYLVAAGVGTIVVCDPDRIDLSNLHRQPLYGEATVSDSKVEVARTVLTKLNSEIRIVPLHERITAANVRSQLEQVDVVVDGSDNFATKYLLNDACVTHDRALVSASIFRFEGQLSVFNASLGAAGRGPTYRCLFPDPPPASAVPNCAEAGVLGVLAGVMGSLQATETLKLLLGFGAPLIGRMLVFDALEMRFSEFRFERNEAQVQRTRLQAPEYYAALEPRCGVAEKELSVDDLRARLESREPIVLVDVRGPEEFCNGDLKGVSIPLDTLRQRVSEVPREGTVVLFCQRGSRSLHAAALLAVEFGFTNVMSLRGGMSEWNQG